jgi:hypothetical protein
MAQTLGLSLPNRSVVSMVRLFVVNAPEDEAFVSGFLLPAVGLAEAEVLLSTRLELGAPVVTAQP